MFADLEHQFEILRALFQPSCAHCNEIVYTIEATGHSMMKENPFQCVGDSRAYFRSRNGRPSRWRSAGWTGTLQNAWAMSILARSEPGPRSRMMRAAASAVTYLRDARSFPMPSLTLLNMVGQVKNKAPFLRLVLKYSTTSSGLLQREGGGGGGGGGGVKIFLPYQGVWVASMKCCLSCNKGRQRLGMAGLGVR